MKTNRRLLTPILLAILSGAAHGQSFTEMNGEWHIPANWSTGALPTESTVPIINNSHTANITAGNPAALADILRVGNQNHATHFGRLSIAGDLDVTRNIQIASALNAEGYVTHTAGTVTFGSNFQVASIGAGSKAEYTISGGTLSGPAGNIAVGTQGAGLFHVSGDTATVLANSMNIGATATLRFTLGAGGASPIAINAGVTIADGATLIVDGAAFTGSLGSISLIQAAGITGGFGDNVTFENFGALTPELSQVGGSLTVIPEPRVYGLALCLLAFAGIFLRRLRARA